MKNKRSLSKEKKARIQMLQAELNMCYRDPLAYSRRGEEYIKALKAEIAKLDEE